MLSRAALWSSSVTRTSAVAALYAARRNVSTVFKEPHDAYIRRHIGPTEAEATEMLAAIDDGKYKSVDALMMDVVPKHIQRTPLSEFKALTESEALSNLKRLMMKNKMRKAFIGQGYFEALTPPVIQRNVLENPGWYTPYTPYQAEISQGRLESLLNYQTAVTDLTKMEIANASLLDEATAAVEAVFGAISVQKQRRAKDKNVIFVDERCFPATIEMIRCRVDGPRGKVVVGNLSKVDPKDPKLAVIVVQTPDVNGALHDFGPLFDEAHKNGVIACCGTDLMACASVKPPGEMGADFVYGNAQRLGIPLGFGGPHPAFFAAKFEHRRHMPGRIIGVSIDAKGRRALRMALQTREQHIKRDNATSNVCTAQALLANMVAFYCVYHGPTGIKEISNRIHRNARVFALGAEMVGHTVVKNGPFFDTVQIKLSDKLNADQYLTACDERRLSVWKVDQKTISVSIDEATTDEHLVSLLESLGMERPRLDIIREATEKKGPVVPAALQRTSPYLQEEVFQKYHCETELMRYITKLQRKDYGLTHGMVPLGSCTMKLNAAATMLPMSWVRVNSLHPFVPEGIAEGYKLLAVELSERLKDVAGLDAVSLQPNSGAQGEYAGLRVIQSYLNSIGENHRNLCLIPANAHGTNPATCALVGFKPLTVKCQKSGAIDMDHLRELIAKNGKNIGAIMITYPSTYGVFDNEIKEITKLVHETGAQVYIDGANFNAMLGRTGPGFFGGDVCHFNLHKTFSIPHGGGGPGMGPIACKAHLAPFLPQSAHASIFQVGGKKAFGLVSNAPLGSASILTISYMLISMLGSEGMKHCGDFAVLNANYLMARLKDHYQVKYRSVDTGRCAHEFIVDIGQFAAIDVKAEDVAKRLMDYGFHAPTVSFPVSNSLMIEPTESESKAELDRLVAALLAIRGEIAKIESGEWPKDNNPLKNAPHTAEDVVSSEWNRPYTRETAAFPMGPDSSQQLIKFWPAIGRINNEFGDQNLFCTCGPAPDA